MPKVQYKILTIVNRPVELEDPRGRSMDKGIPLDGLDRRQVLEDRTLPAVGEEGERGAWESPEPEI